MKLDKKKILEEYLKEVDKIFNEKESMTHMTAEQCVDTVCLVIKKLSREKNLEIC